ncbi:cyclic lactone autoinducer peptide [Dorea sp. 5-2]|nr:cyclic lactone autoinducer peptide [Dorea sp. 5-2]
MKRLVTYAMKRKGVINSLMLAGGIVTVLSNYGCCFYIFHQPKLPEALKEVK